ncbi:MAG: hypothetical protein K1X92_14305 [Bacteroidia bacterium]|nr:hypothetical protein [Bacteroidia bacterium]
MLQRVLGNIPFPLHLLLLFLAVVLRLPVFMEGYFQTDEALSGICAQKLIQGESLYSEIWYSGPPFMIWFYGLFTGLFGSYWLVFLRVFTILYVYYTAVFLGNWLAQYRPFDKYPLFPSVLLVVLCSSPWFSLELSPELLMLLPLMIVYRTLIDRSEKPSYSFQPYFLSGVLIMLAVTASYQFIIMFLSVIVLYLSLKRAAVDELTALLGGAGITLGITLMALYFGNSLFGFLDMALLYGLDLLRYEMFNSSFKSMQNSALAFFAVEAIFLIFAVLGFIRFRIKYFTSLLRIRRLEVGMIIWLVGGLTSIFFSVTQSQFHKWLIIAPPIAFYATKVFEIPRKKWMNTVLLIVAFIPAFYIYSEFWYQHFLIPQKNNQTTTGSRKSPIFNNQELQSYFRNKKTRKGIWIMEFQPEMYLALGQKCATKYVDYRIVYQKFHPLPYASTHLLISKVESDAEIFDEFNKNRPDYILDRNNLFPNIREMYPALFYDYKAESVGGYKVYHP